MPSGRAYRSRSAAVWRRPSSSNMEPPTLVPSMWSNVKPLSGATPTSMSPLCSAPCQGPSSGWNATTSSTHRYAALAASRSHPTSITYSSLARV